MTKIWFKIKRWWWKMRGESDEYIGIASFFANPDAPWNQPEEEWHKAPK